MADAAMPALAQQRTTCRLQPIAAASRAFAAPTITASVGPRRPPRSENALAQRSRDRAASDRPIESHRAFGRDRDALEEARTQQQIDRLAGESPDSSRDASKTAANRSEPLSTRRMSPSQSAAECLRFSLKAHFSTAITPDREGFISSIWRGRAAGIASRPGSHTGVPSFSIGAPTRAATSRHRRTLGIGRVVRRPRRPSPLP